jgi:hypothetical protein
MPMGMANPVLGLLSQALSLPALATTADRASYGEPLTNSKKANVPFLRPETADALMMAPLSPRTALGLAGMGAVDSGAMRAATVFHGSPHKFDKLDASKIGTGEGARVYGHGLYFAESPDVAQSYKVKLSGLDQLTTQGRAARYMEAADGDTQAAMRLAWNDYNTAPHTPQIWRNHASNAVDALRSGKVPSPSFYKVDLPDAKIARMLDWDNALSEAQRVPLSEAAMKQFGSGLSGTSGEHLYKEVVFEFKNAGHKNPPQAASDWLRANGVPGIRYLDGGSRDAGAGSSNYVVFPGEESALTILERNGRGLLE